MPFKKINAKIKAFYDKQLSYDSIRDPSDIKKINKDSFLFYYGNVYSQKGQDGILSEIFRRLKTYNFS